MKKRPIIEDDPFAPTGINGLIRDTRESASPQKEKEKEEDLTLQRYNVTALQSDNVTTLQNDEGTTLKRDKVKPSKRYTMSVYLTPEQHQAWKEYEYRELCKGRKVTFQGTVEAFLKRLFKKGGE